MPGVEATTKSPAARPLTAEPTASTWPTPSLPAAAGKDGLAVAPKPAMPAKSVGVIGAAIMRTRTADGASDLHGERRAAARESLAWHAGGGCAADAGRRLFFRLPD